MHRFNTLQQRIKNNLTQEELASKIGVSRTTVTMWETGKSIPRFETVEQLSKLFGCDQWELFIGGSSQIELPKTQNKGIEDVKIFNKDGSISVFINGIELKDEILKYSFGMDEDYTRLSLDIRLDGVKVEVVSE